MMSKALITELAAWGPASRYLPEPAGGAAECAGEVPAALRRAAPLPLAALDEAALRAHFADVAADAGPAWPGAAIAARAAGLPGLGALHPLQPPATAQGALEVIHEVARALAAITGLDRFSLQPAGTSEAERAALRLAVASFARTQPERRGVVAPTGSSALAQASELGLEAQAVGRLAGGELDVEAVEGAAGPATAIVVGTWLTPEGRLDRALAAAGQVAHARGALFGVDAAGLGRLAGHTRLREAGADIAWLSLAELCPVATGAAIGVRSPLTQYLPSPLVSKERSGYALDDELPGSIGPLAPAAGRLADALAVYALLRTLGEAGLRERAAQLAKALAPGGQPV